MIILFTSVGRRVELMQAFREASSELNIGLSIIGEDPDNTAPALYFCDKKINSIPRINNTDYIDSLLDLCISEGIDCIIPTIDTNLIKLSENKTIFESKGIKVFIRLMKKF